MVPIRFWFGIYVVLKCFQGGIEEFLSEKIANGRGILIISRQMTIFSTFYVGKISSFGILEESIF